VPESTSILTRVIGLIDDEANSRAINIGKRGKNMSIQPKIVFNEPKAVGDSPEIVNILAVVNLVEIVPICSIAN
jgi:hypothetical protein